MSKARCKYCGCDLRYLDGWGEHIDLSDNSVLGFVCNKGVEDLGFGPGYKKHTPYSKEERVKLILETYINLRKKVHP